MRLLIILLLLTGFFARAQQGSTILIDPIGKIMAVDPNLSKDLNILQP